MHVIETETRLLDFINKIEATTTYEIIDGYTVSYYLIVELSPGFTVWVKSHFSKPDNEIFTWRKFSKSFHETFSNRINEMLFSLTLSQIQILIDFDLIVKIKTLVFPFQRNEKLENLIKHKKLRFT